jgi:outer membrane biosynthesis protein TonB
LALDDPLTSTVIVVVVIAACLLILYAMRGRGKRIKKTAEEEKSQVDLRGLPFKVMKSVSSDEAGHAKDELRILDLEREILSDAIRRLYEAHAEGKISEEERERLAQTYKARMMTVKDAISRDESVVALHELEAMQEDLMKLFSERFDELSGKIDELRVKTETTPLKEISIPVPEAASTSTEEEKTANEEKSKKKRKAPSAKPSPRSEAEKRIEEIRNEVEKVLDRLGQMEIES